MSTEAAEGYIQFYSELTRKQPQSSLHAEEPLSMCASLGTGGFFRDCSGGLFRADCGWGRKWAGNCTGGRGGEHRDSLTERSCTGGWRLGKFWALHEQAFGESERAGVAFALDGWHGGWVESDCAR